MIVSDAEPPSPTITLSMEKIGGLSSLEMVTVAAVGVPNEAPFVGELRVTVSVSLDSTAVSSSTEMVKLFSPVSPLPQLSVPLVAV